MASNAATTRLDMEITNRCAFFEPASAITIANKVINAATNTNDIFNAPH